MFESISNMVPCEKANNFNRFEMTHQFWNFNNFWEPEDVSNIESDGRGQY